MRNKVVLVLIFLVFLVVLGFLNSYVGFVSLEQDINVRDFGLNEEQILDLNEYFKGENLSYSVLPTLNFDIKINGSLAVIKPKENFIGEETTIFSAYENETVVNSNIVLLRVVDNKTEENVSEESFGIPIINESNESEVLNESKELFDVPEIIEENVTNGSIESFFSNDFRIFAAPTQDNPLLNSSTGTNYTNENLTIFNQTTADTDGDNIFNVYRWYRNDAPLAVLIMPFEGGTTNAVKDLSGNTNDGIAGTGSAAPFWNSTGGLNKTGEPYPNGAYEFDGVNGDFINISDDDNSLDLSQRGITIEAWIKPKGCNDDPGAGGAGGNCGYRTIVTKNQEYLLRVNPFNEGNSISFFVSNSTIIPGQVNEWEPRVDSGYNVSESGNNWIYVVATWNGSLLSIYINGTLMATTPSRSLVVNQTTNSVIIGRRHWIRHHWSFNGTIDEVRIYNFSVSADYVSSSYNNSHPKYDSWYSSDTKKHENYTGSICVVDDAELGSCLNSTTLVIKNFIPNQTKPVINTSQLGNFTSENITAHNQSTLDYDEDNVTNIYKWYKNNNSVIVAMLPFEGGSNGTGSNGTYTKDYIFGWSNASVVNATWNQTGGVLGGAYEFSGENYYYLNISNYSSVSLTDESVELWFKPRNVTGLKYIFVKGVTNDRFNIRLNSDVLDILDDINARGDSYSSGSTSVTANSWHHLVYTCNATGRKNVYLDGQLEIGPYGGNSCSDQVPYAYIISNWISGTIPFNGSIDEFRVYNFTLTSKQIEINYNNGVPRYNTISSTQTHKGESWMVEITPNDGDDDGNSSNSSELILFNEKPVVTSVRFSPNNVYFNTNFFVSGAYSDADLDQEINSTMILYRNGVEFRRWNGTQLFLCHWDDGFTCDSGTEVPIENNSVNLKTAKFNDGMNISVGSNITYNPYGNIDRSKGTVEFWVKTAFSGDEVNYNAFFVLDGPLRDAIQLFKGDNSFPDYAGQSLIFNIEDSTGGGIFDEGHLVMLNLSGGIWNSSEWYHIAAAWDIDNGTGSQLRLYLNGDLVNSTPGSTGAITMAGTPAKLYVGKYWKDVNDSLVDELRVSNVMLSDDEIKKDYELGRAFNNQEVYFSASNFSLKDNLIFEYCPNDGIDTGNCVNSSTLTLEEGPPDSGSGPDVPVPVICSDQCSPGSFSSYCVSENSKIKAECVLGGDGCYDILTSSCADGCVDGECICESSWQCDSWGSCINDVQECLNWLDSNDCGNEYSGVNTRSCVSGVCGNNIIEGDEECDGENLAGNSCESLNFVRGILRCSGCSYDTSGCELNPLCEDGILNNGEEEIDCGGPNCPKCGLAGLNKKRKCFESYGMSWEEVNRMGVLYNLMSCNITEEIKLHPKLDVEYKCNGIDLTIENALKLRTSLLRDKPLFLLSLVKGDDFKEQDYCPWCYNNVLDYDEVNIDCGGSCGPCVERPMLVIEESKLPFILWILLFILLILNILYYYSDKEKSKIVNSGLRLLMFNLFVVDSLLLVLDATSSLTLNNFLFLFFIIIGYFIIIYVLYSKLINSGKYVFYIDSLEEVISESHKLENYLNIRLKEAIRDIDTRLIKKEIKINLKLVFENIKYKTLEILRRLKIK